MERRGIETRSQWFDRSIYTVYPDDRIVLGLSTRALVSQLSCLRIVYDTSLVIEDTSLVIKRSAISASVLSSPQ